MEDDGVLVMEEVNIALSADETLIQVFYLLFITKRLHVKEIQKNPSQINIGLNFLKQFPSY